MYIRAVIIGVLLLVISGTSVYSYSVWTRDQEEIVIQLAEYFDRLALPHRLARLSSDPRDTALPVPVDGVRRRDIADTWGQARAMGRTHEGTDIFAKRGAPVYAVTRGYVVRVGENNLGGTVVLTMGPGGIRYYYAHLDRVAEGLSFGDPVTTDTVLGYVGNTGNAAGTPPHLHLGVYGPEGPENPYPLLIDRP